MAKRTKSEDDGLPGVRPDNRPFDVGQVVTFDAATYVHLTRPGSAMAELAARRLPVKVGQVSVVDGPVVEVIWEDGRLGVFSRPQHPALIKWTSTEVLRLDD